MELFLTLDRQVSHNLCPPLCSKVVVGVYVLSLKMICFDHINEEMADSELCFLFSCSAILLDINVDG